MYIVGACVTECVFYCLCMANVGHALLVLFMVSILPLLLIF